MAFRHPPLALSMGDPAGIGLDITLAAWVRRSAVGLPPFVLYADVGAVQARARHLGLEVPLVVLDGIEQAEPGGAALPVVAVGLAAPVVAGRPDAANAAGTIAAIDRAVADTLAGRAAAVVTNPVAKVTLHAAGFRHPGHTEYLAELAGKHCPARRWQPVMMLAADALRVVPLTIHMPLAAVPAAITRELIVDTVRIVAADLARRFAVRHARLAIAGLNPHAGESGSLGREEIDVIAPAIASLQAEGLAVTGPLSADTMFHAAARARYDAAICMYHDQALIPLKTLAFDDGVNVTLGLPFVRTSPDHGTAFDIAGTGRANPASLVAALRLAQRLAESDAGAGAS